MTTTPSPRRARAVAKVLALPWLLLGGLAGLARPQTLPPAEALDPAAYRISVNVDLVVLQATVRDRNGRFVSDLREQDFQVYEDGVRQAIRLFRDEDTPVTVGLIVDHSGSMKAKLGDVIDAARTFIRLSNVEDEVFVVNFNEYVTLGLPGAIRFTNRPDELERAILRQPATGQTALYDAVVIALKQLQSGKRDRKALVIISDGGDNRSTVTLPRVLERAERSSATLYTLGIFSEQDSDRNPGVLRHLARATGGLAIMPDKPGDLTAACERIARDIRHQYTIGYISTNATQPGTRRGIRLAVDSAGRGKLSVRTRSGYIASGQAQPEGSETAK